MSRRSGPCRTTRSNVYSSLSLTVTPSYFLALFGYPRRRYAITSFTCAVSAGPSVRPWSVVSLQGLCLSFVTLSERDQPGLLCLQSATVYLIIRDSGPGTRRSFVSTENVKITSTEGAAAKFSRSDVILTSRRYRIGRFDRP
ncbi:hypothetical protein EVAR_88006_1 [Eumeta japonica]|uniref:Uncharacterized protein n=1 Tax=Eumeta variegata TaxID=151549 RepID=A0A4C1VCC1_EUMVA|nr:hypothetical protein EVAR_88006_1 [Eumeta japonica]